MPKPARYFSLFCTLAASVCLLATAAALGTLGHIMSGYWNFAVPLGGDHSVYCNSNWSDTTVGFDRHRFTLPVSNLHFTLVGLIGLALLFLVVAGIVARPLFRRAGREAEAPAFAEGEHE